MSHNSPITATSGQQSPAAPRAPYVRPTLEPLGSWSALTTQLSIPGGFIDFPIVRKLNDRKFTKDS